MNLVHLVHYWNDANMMILSQMLMTDYAAICLKKTWTINTIF